MFTPVGELPKHQYVWIDTAFRHREPQGFAEAVWFGLVSMRGRVRGCTVMLKSGAIFRNLPVHALAFRNERRCAISTSLTSKPLMLEKTRIWRPIQRRSGPCSTGRRADAGRLGIQSWTTTVDP